MSFSFKQFFLSNTHRTINDFRLGQRHCILAQCHQASVEASWEVVISGVAIQPGTVAN